MEYTIYTAKYVGIDLPYRDPYSVYKVVIFCISSKAFFSFKV